MTRTLIALALVAAAGTGGVSAGSGSAQMAVSVTVVRSCAIAAQPAGTASPALRLNCANGAARALRVSDLMPWSATVPSANPLVPETGLSPMPAAYQVVTLNF